jgi:hypothetical protein
MTEALEQKLAGSNNDAQVQALHQEYAAAQQQLQAAQELEQQLRKANGAGMAQV